MASNNCFFRLSLLSISYRVSLPWRSISLINKFPRALLPYSRKPAGFLSSRSFYISSQFRKNCATKMALVDNSMTLEPSHETIGKLNSYEEVQIPVPWGHLAAKVWGSKDGIPVLALHGWQDNAGTFDTLAPLLPANLYLVCLDFSGHGLSSHLPPGIMYNFWDYVISVKLVANYFKWTRFSILGHSLGAAVGISFGAICPDLVDKIVMLDLISPMSVPAESQPDRSAAGLQAYQDTLKKLEKSPPLYTYEDARARLMKASFGSLNENAAEVLMRRGLKSNQGGGFFFSRDLRVAIPSMINSTAEQRKQYAKRICCSLMIIKADQGPLYEDKKVCSEILEIYKENAKVFEFVEVQGSHHVHLIHPERVASHVTRFLTEFHSTL